MPDQIIKKALSHFAGAEPSETDVIEKILTGVRSHLGMEVAYVSEFVGDQSVFTEVDAPGREELIKPGDRYPLDSLYCPGILDGRIPELMPDTSQVPATAEMPITANLPIGSHISVPIKLPDGNVYGMFCCFKSEADPSLNSRDLQMMKVLADVIATQIANQLDSSRERDEKLRRIAQVVERDEISIVYQPIVRLSDDRVTGFESLARFAGQPYRTPDVWFAEALQVGRAAELEMAAIRKAMEGLKQLPPDIYLTVNASPDVVMRPEFFSVFEGVPLERVVLEITEHAKIACYPELISALGDARRHGLRVAVDDAGAGYAGFRHILDLKPDFIKLDITLTRDIDNDPARRALASALINFAHDTGSRIVAEGVETEAELNQLRALGVEKGQGYFLGKPAPLTAILAGQLPGIARAA